MTSGRPLGGSLVELGGSEHNRHYIRKCHSIIEAIQLFALFWLAWAAAVPLLLLQFSSLRGDPTGCKCMGGEAFVQNSALREQVCL